MLKVLIEAEAHLTYFLMDLMVGKIPGKYLLSMFLTVLIFRRVKQYMILSTCRGALLIRSI
jgi:hypothetical protein